MRLLGLSIGMTSASVGAVLAAVFLGMAVGSWLSGSVQQSKYNGIRIFALVEMGVGASALLLLPVMLNLDHLMAMLPALGSQLWFRFFVSTLLLAIPAAGIGAAYPLIANIYAAGQSAFASRLGHLYMLHTVGAVAGVLLSAFVLLPNWGLDGTLYTAVSINLLIAAAAWLISTKEMLPYKNNSPITSDSPKDAWLGLVVLGASGLCAVAAEIGWVKYLSVYIESTVYSFSVILAIVLSGIAAGSWFGKTVLRKCRSLRLLLAIGLIALATAMIVSRAGLSMAPEIEGYISSLGGFGNNLLLISYVVAILTLFPSALLLGVLFPLSLSLYCGSASGVQVRIGQGYAVNTLAGLVGASLAGLWIIPSYGTDMLLLLLAIMVGATALLFIPTMKSIALRTVITVLVGVAVISGISAPALNYQKLISHIDNRNRGNYYMRSTAEAEFLFLKEGHAGVVSLVKYDGVMMLKKNSLNESQLPIKRARSEMLLGLIPTLLKPEAKNAFVVGYGAGTTSRILAATDLESITTVELEPAIVEAMASLGGEETSVLHDKRHRIEYNDARNTLLLNPSQYDIIVSQPSHPWSAGSGALFSSDFFRIAHSRLKPGGVFGQWVNLYKMDATTLRSLLRTFYEEFPHGVVFNNNLATEIVLFGFDSPLELDYDYVKEQIVKPELKAFMKALAIKQPEHLLRKYFLFTRDVAMEMARDATVITDLNLFTEIRLAAMFAPPAKEEDPMALIEPYTR